MAENDRKGKSLADYARMMGFGENELRKAMDKFGVSRDDLVNQQKRGVLADAIEGGWSRDRFKANYDQRVAESADFDWKEIVSQYGYSLGVLQEYKEDLKPIFQWLAKQLQRGETLDNLKAEFEEKVAKTAFGKRPNSEILADLERYNKLKRPEFQKNLGELAKEIRRVAQGKYGDSILNMLEGPKGRELALKLIYDDSDFLLGNFDSEKILRAVEPLWRQDNKNPGNETGNAPADDALGGGESGDYRASLLAWLSRNGVVMDSTVVNEYLDKLLNKNWSMDQVKQQIRDTTFTRQYEAYADFFAKGQDVSEIAMDYRSVAADLLEKSVDAVSIDDPLVKRAMQYKGADGKPAAMTMWEFEREVRKDPEWDKTDNAMRAYTNLGETILKNFGFRG